MLIVVFEYLPMADQLLCLDCFEDYFLSIFRLVLVSVQDLHLMLSLFLRKDVLALKRQIVFVNLC